MTKVGDRQESRNAEFEDPAVLHAALADPRLGWLWLVLRVAVGWFLLDAGWRQAQVSDGASHLVATALTLAGIALILGAFSGVAAFVGGSFAILSSAASGPAALALFAAVVWLVLAWKTAGWIGLDRWLLPMLGMPWRGGSLLGRGSESDAVIAGRAIHRRGIGNRLWKR